MRTVVCTLTQHAFTIVLSTLSLWVVLMETACAASLAHSARGTPDSAQSCALLRMYKMEYTPFRCPVYSYWDHCIHVGTRARNPA